MSDAQARARHRQRIDDLCAAALRALSGDPDVHFRGRRPHRGHRPLPFHSPHLRGSPADDLAAMRGVSDGLAQRLSLSDSELHGRLRPAEPVARLVFELLEQFRVESLVRKDFPGMVANLRHRHEQWSLGFHRAGHTEGAHGLLLYTIAQICRSRVTGQPVVTETEDLIESTRFWLAPRLGHELAGLRRCRTDQQAYSAHALSIAAVADDLVAATTEQDDVAGDDTKSDPRFALFLDTDDELGDGIATASAGPKALGQTGHSYRAFTTAYDRQHAVTALVRPALLAEYRQSLDQRIAANGLSHARLARRLLRMLAEPASAGWDGGQEEGHIDGRRLAQLVTSPAERRLFRTERIEPLADCLVTFLVDCSGSMKEHAESVALIVDVFARALELAGARSEILGFTTAAWNGGRAMRDWRRAGRPGRPGRLNEVSHLVFKGADTPYRRARPAIAGLLKPDLFREGVDGEAVDWACGRLQGHSERRRLLLVFSDGSPMDTATALANDAHYLDKHLVDVVRQQERAGTAEIYGVGLGLDLSTYYRRSHALDLTHGVGNAVFDELVTMVSTGPRGVALARVGS